MAWPTPLMHRYGMTSLMTPSFPAVR